MKMGEKKPYLPIFVGSTFVDLQSYRRAVRDALAQLEAIVRGMEHFGSKPGSPVDECLRVVRSCEVYVGIFGMRYGSIPDGYDRSMTHLEYDEAQRLELPSLIYMIDEENQPLLPKNIETGPGAEKLREFKEQLKKRHVVSFFTTPEDLRARIIHDVPELLQEIGAEISGHITLPEAPSDAEVLRQFELLPKMFAGMQVMIEFVSESDFRSAFAEECAALGLEMGACVFAFVTLSTGSRVRIFGERDVALALCTLPKNASVHTRAVTAFGVYKRVDWTDDGPVTTPEVETGLIVKEVLRTEPKAVRSV
jgi:Domain of unknown function (DUF4062)